ncbi:zinc ribbon domain-containing protein [Bacillus sp. FJAT-49711]|uniref:zinc ribbon domain-containing protein n=1 Tax=Bacillus sp. FJAT-49711 TaxID=2833585 RepID=UPI001BCA17D5|nr:zinc ribbon domain-containing protein [Bacillus sp. FJAT-49711]MBS4219482.1 zinc ribbon domain-containing protein [Bacillus sp. FJAT-49711]
MPGKGCIKCGSNDAGTKDVAMTGTGLSKMFDIQHNQFTVVFCKNCGYSEFYDIAENTCDFNHEMSRLPSGVSHVTLTI